MLRLLYAHGFASGPASSKGRALDALCAARGQRLERLDLRVPDRERLRLSAMIDVVRGALGEGDRAIAIGSSLGGLTVARAAERDPRIVGVLLIAPAFRLVERWRQRTGEAQWEAWRTRRTMDYPDHSSPDGVLRVDFGFVEDAAEVDCDDAPDGADSQGGLGPRWPDVRVPTTVLHGQRDETVDPALSRTFARGRPNVKLIELDDDHQMHASIPRIDAELTTLFDTLR